MQEPLPDRIEVHDMKIAKWIFVCIAALLLMGCAKGETNTQGKEDRQMDENTIQMIMEAAGCNERRAKAILNVLQQAQTSVPISAMPGADGSNCIVVKNADGKEYEVALNKKFYVYAVKDLSTGENIYMVIE